MERLAWLLLWLYVFSLPLEKSVLLEGVGTISRLAGVIAFAASVLVVVVERRMRTPNLALALAALFAAWSALTWFWSVDRWATSSAAFTVAQLVAMMWLIWERCRDARRQSLLLAAYVAGAACSSVWTIARFTQGRQTYWRRYATTGFEPNDLGVTLALSLPLALYLAHRSRGAAAWLFRAAAALAVAGVLLTASRTAFIAMLVSFLFGALIWRESRPAQRISTAALLALLLLSLVRLAPPASRARLATLPSELAKGTFHNRTFIWKSGLKAFQGHLAGGVGAGAYPTAVRPWTGPPPIPGHVYVAHNTFLSVLVETGPVGFALFGLLLAVLAVFAWVLPWTERSLWFVMLAAWVIGVSTLTWENRKVTWLLFALITTAWASAFREAKGKPGE